jgi:hypothetical protein
LYCREMMRIFYIVILFLAISMNNVMAVDTFVKNSPDHLFKDDEPENVQVNVLITDDRELQDTVNNLIKTQIINQLKSAFPKAKFVFAEKVKELKRSGDHINIMISIKEAGAENSELKMTALTHYHITIYDVSRTPIYIKDGYVKYDTPFLNPDESETAINKAIDVANQRLVAFLQRNIKHKSFKPVDQASK